MDTKKFIKAFPYLYHLTDQNNLLLILQNKEILSTKNIVEASDIENPQVFLGRKRKEHYSISVGDSVYKIRDQKPISEVVLARSLTGNWTNHDFITHLNRRVFFWPNLNRLTRHFNRYQNENPIILRFLTDTLLALNPNVEFCRLNSGATRCNAQWGGNAPERGADTFLPAEQFDRSPREVAEVTVPNFATLPTSFWTAYNPNGPWSEI